MFHICHLLKGLFKGKKTTPYSKSLLFSLSCPFQIQFKFFKIFFFFFEKKIFQFMTPYWHECQARVISTVSRIMWFNNETGCGWGAAQLVKGSSYCKNKLW